MKQRGQQSSLAPPPTLVAPKYGSATGVPRRPGNVGKGPRIEAPPPLSIPSSSISTPFNTNTSNTVSSNIMQQNSSNGPLFTKPRSGSFSVGGYSPRQKTTQSVTHAPQPQPPPPQQQPLTSTTTSEIAITLTTQSSENGNTETKPIDLTVCNDITNDANVPSSSTSTAAVTASTTVITSSSSSSSEGEGITRTTRSRSAASQVKPKLDHQGEQTNTYIPVNVPAVKKAEDFTGNVSFNAKIVTEFAPEKEVTVSLTSQLVGDIFQKVFYIYLYLFYF